MSNNLPEHLQKNHNVIQQYRPNAAMIIRNQQDQILWCERIDYPAIWQFPQGGIDAGESAEQGMWREAKEELGLLEPKQLMVLEERLAEPLCYDFPVEIIEAFLGRYGRSYIGQGQYFFLLRWHGDDKDINLAAEGENREFSRFVWGDVSYLDHTSAFKKEVTRRALQSFGLL